MTRCPINRPGLLALALPSVLLLAAALAAQDADPFRPIALKSRITHVQPMTGIVFWTTSGQNRTDAIQLEYSYMKYNDVVKKSGDYDWAAVDKLLDAVAKRGHQAILRFYFVYPGRETTVPDYIKALPDYRETRAKSEGKPTSFADWAHPELRRFTLEFYEKFAERYDKDARLAFVETGFGLWAEYHIYDGPMQLGKTFPDKAFQTAFLRQLAKMFQETPWLISVDAADGKRTPFKSDRELLKIPFGVFDDSFLCKQHARENEPNWAFFDRQRWQRAPAGGEFSYFTPQDQKTALAKDGPHGIPFEKAAADFHITFMIGNDQPRHQSLDRIRAAGLACGYRFRVLALEASAKESRVKMTNAGVAPLYCDAYVAVNGVRAKETLKGLLPGQERTFAVAAGGAAPVLSIECDRLVAGQRIEFETELEDKGKE